MEKNKKTMIYVAVGAVALFLLLRKKTAGKSAQDNGAGGGAGGGVRGGGSIAGASPIIAPTIQLPPSYATNPNNITPPSGYVVVGNNTLAPLSGLNPNNPSQSVVPISNVTAGRAGGGTTSTSNVVKTAPVALTTAQSSSTTAKFSDFDGDHSRLDSLI